jgi:hypothetical protein
MRQSREVSCGFCRVRVHDRLRGALFFRRLRRFRRLVVLLGLLLAALP